MTRKLENKIALITGGTTGIGLAAAKLFHEEGAHVIVTGRNQKTLEAARLELAGVADVITSDSGDPAAVASLFAQIRERYGRLDALFLNAGVLGEGTIESMPETAFDDVLRINVKGPWLALKHAAPILVPGSAVVLNASINAHLGMIGTSAYAASKAALRSLGRTAAAEFAPKGVRVNVLSPGPTETGIIDKTRDPVTAAAARTYLEGRILLGRMGNPEEVARVALFLASSDSSFMTGEEVVVDGGMTRV